jgi:hypothetical protein
VVKLKYFHVNDAIAEHLNAEKKPATPFLLVKGDPTRKPAMRKDRKGQSKFRRRYCIIMDLSAAYQGTASPNF